MATRRVEPRGAVPDGPTGAGPSGSNLRQDEEMLKFVKSQRAGLPSVETISTP